MVKKRHNYRRTRSYLVSNCDKSCKKNNWPLPPTFHEIIKRWYYNKRTGEWSLWNPAFDHRLSSQRSSPKYLQESKRYEIDSEKIRVAKQKIYAALPKEQKPAWLKGELDSTRKPKNVKIEHVWDEYSRKWVPKDITADALIKHWQDHAKFLRKKIKRNTRTTKRGLSFVLVPSTKKMDSLDVK